MLTKLLKQEILITLIGLFLFKDLLYRYRCGKIHVKKKYHINLIKYNIDIFPPQRKLINY